MGIHIKKKTKQTHLNSKLPGLSTVLIPSMNQKSLVLLKCAKLGVRCCLHCRKRGEDKSKQDKMKREIIKDKAMQEINIKKPECYSTKYSTMRKLTLYWNLIKTW